MRQIFLSFLVLTSTYVPGQNNPSNKNVDLNIVGNLVADKATVNEVMAKFGQATEELVTPEQSLLQYKSGDNLYLFKFDKERKLNDFLFVNQSKNLADHLSYSDVKQARNFKTKTELSKKLGHPTQITVNDTTEVWHYTFNKKTEAQKTLIVRFNLSSPSVVKSYKYFADFNNTAEVPSQLISSFIRIFKFR